MSIRQEISRLFGFTIPKGGWDKAFDTLNRDGRLTFKVLYQIVAILLQREEEREAKK